MKMLDGVEVTTERGKENLDKTVMDAAHSLAQQESGQESGQQWP